MNTVRWLTVAWLVMAVFIAAGAAIFGYYGTQVLIRLAEPQPPQTVIVLPPGTTITTPPEKPP